MSQQPVIIELYAGTRPDGEPVFEKVAAMDIAAMDIADDVVGQQPVVGDKQAIGDTVPRYQLLHSPGFLRGMARGDEFRLISRKAGTFEVLRRSGNLAVRVYSRMPSQSLDSVLTPQVSQLNGRRDVMTDRLLVYSIPLEAGFETIEALFDQVTSATADANWSYGNVYDDLSGEAMNWWLQKPTTNA